MDTTEKLEVIYICKQHPKFNFRLGTKRFTFSDGQLKITDPADVKALDALIAENTTFSSRISKVDKEAAEEFVRNQLRAKNILGGGATKGTVDSATILRSQTPLAERDAAFSGLPPEALEQITAEMADDSSLILTKKMENPVVSTAVAKAAPAQVTPLQEKK